MRLKIILLTIILGIVVWSAIFFIFLGRYNREQAAQIQKNNLVNHSARAFLLPVTETSYLPARDFNVPEPVLNAKAAALFDVKSGRFLYSKNINQRLPIASITKLMSAVVILENLNLNEIFTVSVENINVDGKGADFHKNEQLYGIDLFKIMLIESSNDAALTFATAARQAGVDFIAKMNEKAQVLGMFNTKFADPAGLDDEETFSTASDLIKLMRYVSKVDLIPQTLKSGSITVTSADGKIIHRLINTNRLLNQNSGLTWGKTGYTDGALGTMALEAGINPVRSKTPEASVYTPEMYRTSNGVNQGRNILIGVVLGSNDRFGEAVKLVEWSRKAYRWE